jgi:RNA polymerase sigma-70 factor (ECF subfamily)
MCAPPELMAKRDDHELVAGLERRDECAFEEIDRRYGPQLRSHARRLFAGSGLDPDDLVQDTVMRIWANPPAESVALAAWLHVVLRNRGYDILRSPAVRRASAAPLDLDDRPGRDTSDAAIEREQLRELVTALRELPPRQARALVLHALEGRPQREIAGELGTTERSIKGLVYRARHELTDRVDWSQTG